MRTPAMFCLAMRRQTFHHLGPLDERYEVGLLEDDDYVVIGTWEARELDADADAFAEQYPVAATIGEYRVFAVSERAQDDVAGPSD